MPGKRKVIKHDTKAQKMVPRSWARSPALCGKHRCPLLLTALGCQPGLHSEILHRSSGRWEEDYLQFALDKHPWIGRISGPRKSCSTYRKGCMHSALGAKAKQETLWWDRGRIDFRSMTHSATANSRNVWPNHIIYSYKIKQGCRAYSEFTSRSTKKLLNWAKEGFSFIGFGGIVLLKCRLSFSWTPWTICHISMALWQRGQSQVSVRLEQCLKAWTWSLLEVPLWFQGDRRYS